jgi:hypothetical protein
MCFASRQRQVLPLLQMALHQRLDPLSEHREFVALCRRHRARWPRARVGLGLVHPAPYGGFGEIPITTDGTNALAARANEFHGLGLEFLYAKIAAASTDCARSVVDDRGAEVGDQAGCGSVALIQC